MLIASIHNPENLGKFKAAGAKAAVIPAPAFAIRSEDHFSKEEIIDISRECRKNNLQLYFLMQSFVMEEDIDLLFDTLKFLKPYADGIYYGDEGVYMAAKMLGMEDRLIYQPETLAASSEDASFYLDLGIQAVSLAHELSLEEILSIASRVSGIEVLIHGYFSILYSRRPLVENYLHLIGKEKEDGMYEIIEQTREDRMPVLSDERGTHIFSEAPIESSAQIKAMAEAGIGRFRLDNLKMSDEMMIEALKHYSSILEGIEPDSSLEGSSRWYLEKTVSRKQED